MSVRGLTLTGLITLGVKEMINTNEMTRTQSSGVAMSPRSPNRTLWLLPLITMLTCLSYLAGGGAVAQAHLVHERVGAFSTQLSGPVGIAINQSNNDIWVANRGSSNVVELNPAGTQKLHEVTGFEGFGIAVDNASDLESAGDLYVANQGSGVVNKYNPEGVFICELNGRGAAPCPGAQTTAFAFPEGVAVDPTSGDVYVADTGNNVVDVFSPAGGYINQITGSGELTLEFPGPLTVDANGNLYVAAKTTRFSNEGHFLGTVKFEPSNPPPVESGTTWSESVLAATYNTTALATDSANDVYVADQGEVSPHVTEYSSAGAVLGHLGENSAESLELGYGLAVNNGADTVFYSEYLSNKVTVYNTVNVPTVVTGSVSEVTHGTAEVEGTINPEGATITRCFVEYGTGQQQPCNLSGAEIGTGNSPVTVTAKLEGLAPDKLYGYRLVAEAEGNLGKGAESQFTTLPLAPGVSTDAVGSGPTVDSVMLAGSVDPEGVAATYHFDYGLTTSYGQSAPAPEPELPPATSGQYVTLTLSSLTPGAVYHYRLVASNSGGTTYGPDQTFTTYANAPTVTTGPAQNVGQSTPVVAFPNLSGLLPLPPLAALATKGSVSLTRAQKLLKALKACGKKPKKQRASCKRQARRKYGTPSKKAKRTTR
jgi:DNA-binding beta-propeller fold protein YncE